MKTPGYPSPARLKYLRDQTGMSQAELAVKLCVITGTSTVTRHYVNRWENGKRRPTAWLDALALALGVDVAELCQPGPQSPTMDLQSSGHELDHWGGASEVLRRAFLSRGLALAALPPVVRALDVIGDGDLGTVADGLGELVEHYTHAITLLPPNGAYEELLAVRTYAGTVLDRSGPAQRKTDLALTCGWLSGLLAITAHDLGDHSTSRLWCSDAERRSDEVCHPELAGWAYLTRAMIAHYQRLPERAADLAAQGQRKTPLGSVVHAKLASHQMRAAAMAGDTTTSERARRQAVIAINALPSSAPTTGVFSIPRAEDPPYTATSLLLSGEYRKAAEATERVISTCYEKEGRRVGGNPSGYARSLLILGLAQAGNGEYDEAAGTGIKALTNGHPAWPTLTLAKQLDRALTAHAAGQLASAFTTRYREAADQLASSKDRG